ncbi:ATP-binding protein [Microbacterium sp. No. 7]|uniref:ATP-binding protein n=1 Tax=Microbacterium sp. No. 7 TaxID=1714373 RepID=UPI0006D1F2A3|nr:carboxyl transferase domain-containing protein [Microbacterium sp. No. 7]ALJ21851.1 hypothetical protein AOA12_18895 [Microbacterium sp. No. 7]
MSSPLRVAIVNRGEAAVRFLQTAAGFVASDGRRITSIALVTAADRGSLFAELADETVDLDEATSRLGLTASTPYLDRDLLLAVLRECGAEAVWVGWGFLAEDPAFAGACEDAGLLFIGPSSTTMRRLADKIEAKALAETAGVPVTAWSGGPVESAEEAHRHAERIGFPLFVKSSAGGGGMGIREVSSPADLATAFDEARRESERAFANPTVFLEKRVDSGRHVEVQILADRHGTVWSAGVRECSIQRRRQKVVEESGLSIADPGLQERIERAARDIARTSGYTNAGTVEFLVDAAAGAFYFMEVNTRLQVEHTVTEEITGLDLVAEQLRVALGDRLAAEPPARRGHAVEVRLNAEDPERGFVAAPGHVLRFRPALGPGIRVDTGIREGDDIPAGFDSMVAKIIAWAPDRGTALERLARAVERTDVHIRGGATNRRLLEALLRDDDVRAGRIDTSWLDRRLGAGTIPLDGTHPIAAVAAAVAVHRTRSRAACADFVRSVLWGAPQLRAEREPVELVIDGEQIEARVDDLGADAYRVRFRPGGTADAGEAPPVSVDVTAQARDGGELLLTVAGASHRALVVTEHDGLAVAVDGRLVRISTGDRTSVRATIPGIVVAVHVAEGDEVEAGARLMTIESMKLEAAVVATEAGTVTSISAGLGSQISAGQELVRVESTADGPATGTDHRVLTELGRLSGGARDRLAVARTLMLGFDIDADEVPHALTLWDDPAAESSITLSDEIDLLRTFVDLRRIAPRHVSDDDGRAGDDLVTVLRRRNLGDADLACEPLRSALAHYDVRASSAPDRVDHALRAMWAAFERGDESARIVAAILSRWLRLPAATAGADPVQLDEILTGIVAATEHGRPTVAGAARALRFREVVLPTIEETRREQIALAIRALSAPDDEARARTSALPWQRWVAAWARLGDDRSAAHLPLIAASLYRGRRLEPLPGRDDVAAFAASIDGSDVCDVVAVVADLGGDTLARGLEAVSALIAARPKGTRVLVDAFLPDDGDRRRAVLAALPSAAFVVLHTLPDAPSTRVRTEVFAADGDGALRLDETSADLHPITAERLELWRMREFDVERVPARSGVWLFSARAKADPADRRLFAFAEVHEADAQLDAHGEIESVPALEFALTFALDAIRDALLVADGGATPVLNRVSLLVDAPWRHPIASLVTVAERTRSATTGLGLDDVVLRLRQVQVDGEPDDLVVHMALRKNAGVQIGVKAPSDAAITPTVGLRKVSAQLRRRGMIAPWDVLTLLTSPGALHSELPPGRFQEHDLRDGRAVPVDRPWGEHTSAVVFGVVSNTTPKHPEGMRRVVIINDPSRGMAALTSAECDRIVAAIDLAEGLGVPVEWFTASSGAKVAMDSGTENLDATGRVLRRIVQATQDGMEVNVLVTGVNVGAQSYWDAEATMLMHTRGILVVVGEHAMVLTGKQALDFSGAVSARDNAGIGGYDTIMGPNGNAQYWAGDVAEAVSILFRHYDYAYTAPRESRPRTRITADPVDRDITLAPHAGADPGFATVGDVFDPVKNPERKRAFSIRHVLDAVRDSDDTPLERWAHMADAESAVVWETHIGGYPVTLLGIESQDVARRTLAASDGPRRWSAGTLFPRSSKKVARAINAASGVHPVVVLANLSGFDGSPESMRQLQLEYGAEIGRAVVNFDGLIVFVVLSRYHGGAFVVFSKALNDSLESLAIEGARASVIGGAPAAAVVFSREVAAQVAADERVQSLKRRLAESPEPSVLLQNELIEAEQQVRFEVRARLAQEFDGIHSVERAREVGSIDDILSARALRPRLIASLARDRAGDLVH